MRYPGGEHFRNNGAYPGQIQPGPASNRSAGSGSDSSSQGMMRPGPQHSMYPGGQPPPVQRLGPGPMQPRPSSTVPDSGGVPGFDLAAVRAANMARAEALAAQQREEARVDQQEINMRMQNMQMRPGPPPPPHGGQRYPGPPPRVPPPQHFFPDNGPPHGGHPHGGYPGGPMRPNNSQSPSSPVSPVSPSPIR